MARGLPYPNSARLVAAMQEKKNEEPSMLSMQIRFTAARTLRCDSLVLHSCQTVTKMHLAPQRLPTPSIRPPVTIRHQKAWPGR